MADIRKFASDDAIDRLRKHRAKLAWFGERTLRAEDIDDVLDTAMAAIAEAIGRVGIRVFEATVEGDDLHAKAEAGWPTGIGEVDGPVQVGDEPAIEHALRNGWPAISEGNADRWHFTLSARLRRGGAYGAICVAIAGVSGPWGVVEVAALEDRAFDPDEVAFVESCAGMVAAAVPRLVAVGERVPCPFCGEPVRREAVDWPFFDSRSRATATTGATRETLPRPEPVDAAERAGPYDAGWYEEVQLPPVGRRRVGIALFAMFVIVGIGTVWWASGPSATPPREAAAASDPPRVKFALSRTLPATEPDTPTARVALPEPPPSSEPPQDEASLSGSGVPRSPADLSPREVSTPGPGSPPPPQPPRPTSIASASPEPATDPSERTVRELQSDLALLGYDVGPIDGIVGHLTRRALKTWQAHHHRPRNGRVTPAIQSAIHSEAVAAISPRFR